MGKTVEELLTIAYSATHRYINGKVNMINNYAVNMPKYVQEFTMDVRPAYNRLPKQTAEGVVRSAAVGYKELIVWVKFGDNISWSGPELIWLYMDRSQRWDGKSVSGNADNLDELYKIADMLQAEAHRISKIEIDYLTEHDSYDGLKIEGYVDI